MSEYIFILYMAREGKCMNIKMQCCGIIIIALLIIVYKRQRKLPLNTIKVFRCCLYASFICLILDVASIFGIVYRDKLPAFLPVFICKTYIALLVLVSMLAVIYVAAGIFYHLSYQRKMIIACASFGAIVICLIYALPIIINEDVEKNLAWTSGPSTIVTYLGVFVFIVLNLAQIFRHKEHIFDRQRKVVMIWMYMWIASAIIQMLISQLLIVGFACALSMMLLFIQFENPELYLDMGSGLFNYNAYNRYGEQLYSDNKDFYVFAVIFEKITWQAMQLSRSNIETQKIFDAFREITGAYVFKVQESEFLLFFDKKEDAESAWATAREQMDSKVIETLSSHPSLYYVSNTRCVNSPRELLELLRYAEQQKSSLAESIFNVIDEKMADKMRAENEVTQMIMDALSEDRIVVYYQPIYSMEKKSFTSAEALVRIIDKEGNIVPPAAFIQAAENNGMIIEIGKRVFEKVCYFYTQNNLEEFGLDYVEVNLSVVQCANDKLADDFISIMETAQIDPRHINLEITESTSLNRKRIMISNMERMINYGVDFSLDDFGTGASNLNYIVDMPVKIVKFDRGMIQAYFASGKAKYVMDAAMQMIRGMGLKIVAEGVETEEQYHKMEEIKINYIQGYYFSKPLPEQEFLKFLSSENR